MSTATVIIGKSGSGKSTAMRNLDPAQTLLIQVVRKPLPFKRPGWVYREPGKPGNVIVSDDAGTILKLLAKTTKKIIVIDDFQYMLSNEFMRRSEEKGFEKFTDIARHGWEVFTTIGALASDVRVYVMTHSDEDDGGRIKMKTIGKLLDEKIVLEGLVTLVLRTEVVDNKNYFRTQNNGSDPVKTPMDMFAEERIPNDLAAVDATICAFYDIATDAPPLAEAA